MARIFSGIQPSGSLHLGNYLGAFRQWVAALDDPTNEALYCVVDLHALTLEIDPASLRENVLETAYGMLAVGLRPERCILFVQSHVHEHAELNWLLECTASYGELRRMTQFKEKGANQESVRASLLTYPVLMAADILLYDTDRVPVGDDQRQHLELARDLAIRFNARYGETFVVPEAAIPAVGARVMDLQHPERKMSKSSSSPAGIVYLDEEPDELVRKVRRAVTDAEGGVLYDRERRPGASNLLELLAALTGEGPERVAERYDNYGKLKADLADALVEELRPIRERIAAYRKDPAAVEQALALGSEKAERLAAPVLSRAKAALGLLA